MKNKTKFLDILLGIAGVVTAASYSYGQPTVTILPDINPTYIVFTNASLTFRATATGVGTISYQWTVNSTPISGATSSNLTVATIPGLADSGAYYQVSLIATDSGGSTTNGPIWLQTTKLPPVAYTNYLDTFTRADGTALNGQQPDIASPIAQTWATGPGYVQTNSGSVTWTGTNQAYLGFPAGGPISGHIYTLMCDLNPLPSVAHPDDWEALAMSTTGNPTTLNLYDGAVPWLLMRADRSGCTFFGNGFSGTQNQPAYDPVGTSTTFMIVLDCTTGDTNANTGWTVTFYQDGAQQSQYVYGANPATISYVGMGGGGYGTCGGMFDNFRLYDSQTPPLKPAITKQPTLYTRLYSGLYTNGPTFNVLVSGVSPFQYQWKHAGTNLPNATNLSLTIGSQPSDAGTYVFAVTNAGGYALSSNAVVEIVNAGVGASVLYDDSFSRTGDLSTNSVPDLADFGSNLWATASGMTMDGTQLVRAPATVAEAYLPFVPQWGQVYLLSCDLNPTNGGGSWEAMGFAGGDLTTLTNSGGFYAGAYSWLLYRANRTQGDSIQTFADFFTGQANAATLASSGYSRLSILLDTTQGDTNSNTGWMVQFVEGKRLLASAFFNDALATGTTNPPVQYVGIGGDGSVQGTFDNFVLAQGLVVTLGIQASGGNVTLTWPTGTLQQATSVTGPWSNVTGASAPSYTTTTSGSQTFYRVKVN